MSSYAGNTSISLSVYFAVGSVWLVSQFIARATELSAAQQFQLEVITEAHPTTSATILTTLVEPPNSQETYSVWGLRTYFDQVVDASPFGVQGAPMFMSCIDKCCMELAKDVTNFRRRK